MAEPHPQLLNVLVLQRERYSRTGAAPVTCIEGPPLYGVLVGQSWGIILVRMYYPLPYEVESL